MKSTFFCLVLFLVALPLHAAPATVSDANNAYQYDRRDDAVRLFTELLDRQPAPAKADAADFHYKRAYALFKLTKVIDAYNRRLRIEKKKTCPECNGRGIR